MEAPRFISELKYEVGVIGTLPLREEPLSIPLPEQFTSKCALLCHLSPAVVRPALNPTSIMGMPEISPRVPQVLFSQDHQYRSTKVWPQDHYVHVLWPTVEALEAAQILAWPGPHKHALTKSTAAKTRPISAAVASIVHSDVLPVLNLQRGWWMYKSTAYAAVGRDFSPASLVTPPLGLSCGFHPTSTCRQLVDICSLGLWRQRLAQEPAEVAVGPLGASWSAWGHPGGSLPS